jgi:hypothetical protein
MNTDKHIQTALTTMGFNKTELNPIVFVLVDTGETLGVIAAIDDDLSEQYHDEVQKIPGVLSDDGQGDGYYFQVDLTEFTPESEKKIIKLVEKYRKLCKMRSAAKSRQR